MRDSWKRPFNCYAVARGWAVGVFDSWYACRDSVQRYNGRPLYKGFYSRFDAERWLARQDYRERTIQAALSHWNGKCYKKGR